MFNIANKLSIFIRLFLFYFKFTCFSKISHIFCDRDNNIRGKKWNNIDNLVLFVWSNNLMAEINILKWMSEVFDVEILTLHIIMYCPC